MKTVFSRKEDNALKIQGTKNRGKFKDAGSLDMSEWLLRCLRDNQPAVKA